MITPDLVLDPALKYWVLLPISFVMVLVGLTRSNVTFLLESGPKLEPYKAGRERQSLKRAEGFKQNNNILTAAEFAERQLYYIEKLNSDEYLANKNEPEKDPMAALSDPGMSEAMMNMAKGNIMNYIPQTVIMAWVNYFFAGFVIMKLPFPLTDGFKSMLQNGVATPDLNVRYVSSISWYFVNLFGLRPIYSLLMGDSTAAAALVNQQQQQQQMPQLGGPGGAKADKVFQAEAENVQILKHDSIFDDIVTRVVERNI